MTRAEPRRKRRAGEEKKEKGERKKRAMEGTSKHT